MTVPGPAAEVASSAGCTPASSEARREYAHRFEQRRGEVARMGTADRRLADARLLVFLLALALGWLGFVSQSVSRAWLTVPVAGFVALVFAHERVRVAQRRVARGADLYERGMRRVDGTWAGTGTTGDRFLDPEHPYAADLDLFGVGSIFERLCVARTSAGEATLARWLLDPADPETVRERQEAVEELRPRLDLRETVDRLGADVRSAIDPDALASWGRDPGPAGLRTVGIAAAVLAALTSLTLIAWSVGLTPLSPAAVLILVEIGFAWRQKARVAQIVGPLQRRSGELRVVAELLARLEAEAVASDLLKRLQTELVTAGEPASARVARLSRLLHWMEMRENQAFAPVAAVWLWGTQFAAAIEAWRVRTGPEVGHWLEAVGAFEALSSLAAYAYENPDDPFPEVEDGPARFEGDDLGHPLLPSASCVRNGVTLGQATRVLLISGSNMSGKSTLLRTVGANAVLALAGAPVRAARLRVSVLSIGATLRVQDSLQAGRSRFYAEVARVRQIVELARGPRPLLFLLDEIFHGTNSHDRVAGARGVVRGLIDRGAVGLVTTHDLALAEVADALAPRARNVHFDDQLDESVMRFDYRMKPGVVGHSNALALMRAVGLDV